MKSKIILTLVATVFGLSLVLGFNAQGSEIQVQGVASAEHIENLIIEKDELELQKQELLSQLGEKEATLEQFEAAATISIEDKDIQVLLWQSRALGGLADLQGPGVRIYLNDRPRATILESEAFNLSNYIVHDTDLLGVVNELRSAGAEAIEINGVRILSSSRITCGGPTINVGREERFSPPFIVQAIGDPDALFANFMQDDSIYGKLRFYGLEFRIEKAENIIVPRFYGTFEYKYLIPSSGGV